MNDLQRKLIKALKTTTQIKCAIESGVSYPTVQNIVAGKRVSPQTEAKINAWIETKQAKEGMK